MDLKEDQSLHLLNLEDGDVETNLLEDGGHGISFIGCEELQFVYWGKVHPRQAVN